MTAMTQWSGRDGRPQRGSTPGHRGGAAREVSPTASVLGKLCAAYGLTMSRLMHMVEDDFAPLVRRDAQPVWTDPSIGFRRRSVSPPAQTLAAEALECELDPGARIAYDAPPRPGLEHHLLLIEGQLEVAVVRADL